MKTIVVSGSRSDVGKTTLARAICGLVPGSEYIKLGHGVAHPDRAGSFYPVGTPYNDIAARHAHADYLIIESNSILKSIQPDCAIFLDADNPKPSAAMARACADIIRGKLCDETCVAKLCNRLGLDRAVMRNIIWLAGARPGPVTGIVLAGGKSSRMGTDKALMEISGVPMALRARDALAPFCDSVILSVNPSNAGNFSGLAMVVDDIAGEGPLRGIVSCLTASTAEINLVVACDIPHIDPLVLCTLLSYCDDYDIVIPSFKPGTQEPLYGVYRKNVAAVAQDMLAHGMRRVSELFGKCKTKIVPMDDAGRYANLNTKEDFESYTNNLIPQPLLHRGEGEKSVAKTLSPRKIQTCGVTALQYIDEAKKQKSRLFRRNATPAEKILWSHLRNRMTGGLKFRRQQIIDGFIADFYCEESRLVVEVDGGIHDTAEQKAPDIHREKIFTDRGIITLRFCNENIMKNISKCLQQIVTVSQERNNKMDVPLSERRSTTKSQRAE